MDIIGSELIENNMMEYGKHVVSNTFPNVVDGLKRVKRRIVYTQPTEEAFSGLQLISNTIRIHPYGDSSIYDAACRMADSFRSTFPLIQLIGKGGSYSGNKAASARYTKFKITEFCKDIFFSGINFKTIPMESTEDLSGREIKYFIPKIPTALLFSNESIGFGYSSWTIPLQFENICDLVIDFVLCKEKDRWNYKRLAHLFIPCLPVHVYLKNKADLIEAYSQGKFEHPIETEGVYSIISANGVLFRTLAYGVSPSGIRINITNALKDKNSWLSKSEISFDALSEDMNYTDFRIITKRSMNIFDTIEHLKGLLRIRTPSHIINNFVFNDRMVQLSPPEIIKIWYKERYRSIFSAKKHRQQDLQLQRMRYETYLIVCDYVDDVIAIIRKENSSLAEIHKALKTRFNLSTNQCEILLDSNLQILMRSKRDELEKRLLKIVEELDTINKSFMHIDKEICAEVKALKKKYPTDTKFTSRESEYCGCLMIKDFGIVSVLTVEEALYLAKFFPNEKMWYIPYEKDITQIRFSKYNQTYRNVQAIPYTNNSPGIIIQQSEKNHWFIRHGSGKSHCINDTQALSVMEATFNKVSKTPFVIMNNGKITKAPEDLFDTRRHSASILYAFDTAEDINEYIVISANEAHPQSIRFQQLTVKDKVLLSGAGESCILAVLPLGTEKVLCNLPAFHKNSVILINDISKLMKKKRLHDVTVRNFEKV